MTRYEQLEQKIRNCLKVANRTNGVMRNIWVIHYYKLIDILRNTKICDLVKEV